jgi:hypothetical protein
MRSLLLSSELFAKTSHGYGTAYEKKFSNMQFCHLKFLKTQHFSLVDLYSAKRLRSMMIIGRITCRLQRFIDVVVGTDKIFQILGAHQSPQQYSE